MDALWQEVLAAPHDERLRRRFASSLAERGDSRAEAFRLADELHRFPPYYVQHESLAHQYEDSLQVWRDQLAPAAARWNAELDFVDGWPSQVTIAASDCLRCADEVVATIPLRHLNLTGVLDAPEVFAVAALAQVASLQACRQPWSPEATASLAASEALRSLRWLDLSHSTLTDADVESLARSPVLAGLAYLELEDNPCRNPVDTAEGYGVDSFTGGIVAESIAMPAFGRELEERYGSISWLHSLQTFGATYPDRYQF